MISFNIYLRNKDMHIHSHKKRKNSLERRAEPAVFSLQLEFRKLLEPTPHKPA